eukprot:jgi/Botrbrau1/18769/Bobra.0386s0088.1
MTGKGSDGGLGALFSRLVLQTKNNQKKKALKTVEEILRLSPNDKDALYSKAVLLIDSSKLEEALVVIKDHNLSKELAFEKAYCLYRLANYAEALEALESVDEDRIIPKLHLQAQLYYRQGKYAEAINTYNLLFQTHKVSTAELHTNVLAAYISGSRSSEVPAVMEALRITAKESPDIAFNNACSVLESGDYAAAEKQLLLAMRLGKEMLMEEDAGEDETEEELAPMVVQLAYVAAQLGRRGEAVESYEGVSSKGLADEATSTIAINNLVAERMRLCREKDIKKLAHDCLKKMEGMLDKVGGHNLKAGLETRLSEQQKEGLSLNMALLLLLGNRKEPASDLLRNLAKRWPNSSRVRLARAALLIRDGLPDQAEALLAELPSSSLDATLLRAQLALSSHNHQLALKLLEGLAESGLGDKPAVLATRIDLLEQVGEVDGARSLVEGALAKIGGPRRKGSRAPAGSREDQAGHVWLLQCAASLALKARDTQEALRRYKELEAVDPAAAAASGLLSQLTAARLAEGESVPLVSDLPPIPPLPPAEVDDLEAAFLGSGKMRKHVALQKKRAGGVEEAAPRKRRKHKKLLPKNFDPENPGPPPDPERWLPKWQRSDYKKKRARRKDKDAMKGSQGAGKVDDSLDRTKVEPAGEAETAGKGGKAPPRGTKKKGRR